MSTCTACCWPNLRQCIAGLGGLSKRDGGSIRPNQASTWHSTSRTHCIPLSSVKSFMRRPLGTQRKHEKRRNKKIRRTNAQVINSSTSYFTQVEPQPAEKKIAWGTQVEASRMRTFVLDGGMPCDPPFFIPDNPTCAEDRGSRQAFLTQNPRLQFHR